MSTLENDKASPLIIRQFPCLMDNYGFLIHDPVSGETATIDTPDATAIENALSKEGWTLTHIWNTHHHFDHTGGNLALVEKFGAEIIGPAHDVKRIPGLTKGVSQGESFKIGQHTVEVFETPGHTTSHIIFYVPAAKAAFVGDTIFVMGCGRLFEGTPEDMYKSLALIGELPDDTALYCAHEYTLSNARFAITVEPDNQDMIAYIKEAKALREQDLPTVPTNVAREKAINPFMRAKTANELGEIRKAKDNF